MTSIKPKSTSSIEPKGTSTLEWPLTPQEWRDNYKNYHEEYVSNFRGTPKYLKACSNFQKNNIILNNALLNAKTKPNIKIRKRLKTRINQMEYKISDKQEEIDDKQDSEEKTELEKEKELIISPELLEDAKLYICKHNLEFAKAQFMDQNLYRKPEKLNQLAPDISEMIQRNLIGKGKKRRKNTRKKSKKKKNKKGKSKSKSKSKSK